ncbi:hypothetical protein RCL1_001891 [Eukaryota sp. TZLM3-RCL]
MCQEECPFTIGKIYDSMNCLRDEIQLYENSSTRALIRIRSEPACVNLACSVAGCNFSLYASRKKNLPSVIIRRFTSHLCLDNPLIPATFSIPSTTILGNLTEVKEEVAKNALIPAKKIAEVIANACGVAPDDISAQKALRARNIARIHVYGSFEYSYADLPLYGEVANF